MIRCVAPSVADAAPTQTDLQNANGPKGSVTSAGETSVPEKAVSIWISDRPSPIKPYIHGGEKDGMCASSLSFSSGVSDMYTVEGFPLNGSADLCITTGRILKSIPPRLRGCDITFISKISNGDVVELEKDKHYMLIGTYGIDSECKITFKRTISNTTKSARNK